MENWPQNLSPQELAHWLNRQYGANTLMHRLKMQIIEVGPQGALIQLPVHPGLHTPNGYIHAGVMLSLTDTAATIAAIAAIAARPNPQDPAQLPVAVSISSQIVGNIREGILIARAQIPHPGRTLIAAATRVTDGNHRLLALVNSTHYLRPPATAPTADNP